MPRDGIAGRPLGMLSSPDRHVGPDVEAAVVLSGELGERRERPPPGCVGSQPATRLDHDLFGGYRVLPRGLDLDREPAEELAVSPAAGRRGTGVLVDCRRPDRKLSLLT